MQRRDVLKVIGLGSASLALGGCATEIVREMDHPTETYIENLDSVLISEDTKNLVVIGDSYDYIFRDTEHLAKLIQGAIHPHVSGDFRRFQVGKRNSVVGDLYLKLHTSEPEIVQAATAHGFKPRENGQLFLRVPMRGTRYRKNPDVAVGQVQQLNNRYSVDVRIQSGVNPGKLLLTPVAVAVDGALLLLGIPLVIVFALFARKHK